MSRIYFAQIREDSLVERRVLERRPARRVLCIGSGGCTALSLLRDTVDAVLCVDSNPSQCALIELRRAALAELSRDAFLEFIGDRPSGARVETFRALAPRLPRYARTFWEAHLADVAFGINHVGVTERFYRFASENLRSCVCPDAVFEALLECGTIEQQRALHARHFRSEAWRTALRILFSRTSHMAFYPAFMFSHSEAPDFGEFFAERFDHQVLSRPLRNNYFLSQFLFGTYRHHVLEGSPAYLGVEGYELARRNAHKLVVIPESLESVLEREGELDGLCLSNVFDWMPRGDRERACRAILHAARPGAAVVFRNMLALPALPAEFMARLRVDEEASRTMLELERSMLYRRVTVGEVA